MVFVGNPSSVTFYLLLDQSKEENQGIEAAKGSLQMFVCVMN